MPSTVKERVASTKGRNPMHPRDSAGEQASTADAAPDTIDPFLLEEEEKTQSADTCRNGDGCGTDDKAHWIVDLVVADTKVSDVMHASDGQPSTNTTCYQHVPEEALTGLPQFDGGEANEEKHNR